MKHPSHDGGRNSTGEVRPNRLQLFGIQEAYEQNDICVDSLGIVSRAPTLNTRLLHMMIDERDLSADVSELALDLLLTFIVAMRLRNGRWVTFDQPGQCLHVRSTRLRLPDKQVSL